MFTGSDVKGQNFVATTPFGKVYSNDGGKTFSSITDFMGGQSVKFSETKVWAP